LKPSAEDELLAVGQASMANPDSFSDEAGAGSIREVVPAVTVEFRAVLIVPTTCGVTVLSFIPATLAALHNSSSFLLFLGCFLGTSL